MAYHLKGIKYNQNFDIVGFNIKNVIDEKTVTLDELENMWKNGEAIGFEVLQDENNQKHIQYSEGDLKELPMVYSDNKFRQNELEAVAVLISDNSPYGYRFKVGDTEEFQNYGLDVVWELARRGCIRNMQAKVDNQIKVICGKNNFKLWELEVIVRK